MNNPLQPSPALLSMLGSIVVHADEGLSDDRHHFDMIALRTLMANAEVREWLKQMDEMAMIPKKRKP
jgi:hypothetical protein